MPDSLMKWDTWRQIHAQPGIWNEWGRKLPIDRLRQWIEVKNVREIWFCGAGSSSFIGDLVASCLEGQPGPRLRSVPSTDLVSRPEAYLNNRRPLVVSFGRSGNTAESLGTMDALDVFAPDAPRLNITCNPESALADQVGSKSWEVILLPEAAHDAGFAMVASFSAMVLTSLELFDARETGPFHDLAHCLSALLPKFVEHATSGDVSARVVFIGTCSQTNAARESALKILELTAGQVPALWECSLDFRHGPRSFVSDNTAVNVFKSSNPHSALYDDDLISEIRTQFPASKITVLGPAGDIVLNIAASPDDAWLAPIHVAPAQVLATVSSDRLGPNVDNPFAGTTAFPRVVSNVALHLVPRVGHEGSGGGNRPGRNQNRSPAF